jgi:3-hydroxyisobutyrate dehydrogenase-like beta-hydroxyacid dehydrogenase
MPIAVAVIAPGAMGSAVGQLLTERGVMVVTLLDGRGEATVRRAEAAGMIGANEEAVAAADIILSIVPPAQAEPLALRLQPAIAQRMRKPIYIDCNALNVDSKRRIGAIVADAGAPFVDGAIIGSPPRPGYDGPTFYLSGEAARSAMPLAEYGLRLHILESGLGAAAALKMSYTGITKGLTAIAAAMVLSAARAGTAEELAAELAESQPHLLARFSLTLPDMFPKAYRWVAEMEEIASSLRDDDPARLIYEGAAGLYARLARDFAGEQQEIEMLSQFVREIEWGTESSEEQPDPAFDPDP